MKYHFKEIMQDETIVNFDGLLSSYLFDDEDKKPL
jgi:hypothetical protein